MVIFLFNSFLIFEKTPIVTKMVPLKNIAVKRILAHGKSRWF